MPDTAYEHDFYRVANEIIGNMDTVLQLTVYGDDICKPCNRLDTRLLTLLVLNTDEAYTARAILDKLYRKENIIFLVWREEQRELTEKRNALFQKGCEKFLGKFSAC